MTESEEKGANKLNLPKVTDNIWIGSDYRGVPGHRNWQIETAVWIGPLYYVYEA